MGIAESVYLQRTYIRWKEGKVLSGRGEHVPRIEIKEGHEEIDSDCRPSGDDEVGEDVVAKMKGGFWVSELDNNNVDGRKDRIRHNYRIANKTAHEHFLGSGW